MAIYRSDQAQLTFAGEATQGADPEFMQGEAETSSAGSTTLSASVTTGDRTITVASATNFVVGSFIRIGTVEGTYANTKTEHEVRRIEANNSTTFTLDRPLAFTHPLNDDGSASEVVELKDIGGTTAENDNSKYITFIPGVYETVDTPDPEMSIEGRHFLSTQSKRNWSVAYSGQQSLLGSVGGITLLNGWPLRFPIGSVTTTASTLTGDIDLNGATVKGAVFIVVDGTDADSCTVGTYIKISGQTGALTDGSNAEIRRVVTIKNDVTKTSGSASGSNVLKLNYPLQLAHDDNSDVQIASGTYTHTINETNKLDTVSWHVHMKDSSEDADKDFDRRYLGGMIGSSTITAEEGGLVTMSWDSVNFLNMVHNQRNQETVAAGGSDLYTGASPTANMPRFALMQTIDSDDVGMPGHMSTVTDANTGVGYPTTQPYYFSEGTIKFFGKEFARIRSFSLSISNGEEPRYYIGKQGARARGPFEIREGARDYSMAVTVDLPDAIDADTSVGASDFQSGALELFRQLLLEGDYGHNEYKSGFNATIKFERGASDYIIIDIPGSSTAGSPTTATNQINKQGIFIASANHPIGGSDVLSVDLNMLFRSLKITIVDGLPVYP